VPRLLVNDRARSDVDEIARHIARDSLDAALRFYDRAEEAFDFLCLNPGAGPRFETQLAQFQDLRSWPIRKFRNYLILYRPTGEGVEILRVLHGAQDVRSLLVQG
jgi:toxin ParE1/3/4